MLYDEKHGEEDSRKHEIYDFSYYSIFSAGILQFDPITPTSRFAKNIVNHCTHQ
jgi:hypothetical protein